jgi:pyruvate/2-oxoacid:ferredoxin oxidoreductase beta subunit
MDCPQIGGRSHRRVGYRGKTIGVSPVGCAYNNYLYFNCDMVQAAHGRAPAVATGIKRSLPDNIVFTYQGDGDLAAIGTAEIVHAATRGENITVVFINNTIYGMTSGQMAPHYIIGADDNDHSIRKRSKSQWISYPNIRNVGNIRRTGLY